MATLSQLQPRVRTALLCFALALLGSAHAIEPDAPTASQPPTPSGREGNRHQPANSKHPDGGGTPTGIAGPLPTNISRLQNADSEELEQQESAEAANHWWTIPDWWIAGLTFILALATWRLVVKTRDLVDEAKTTSARQGKETLEALRIAQDAADTARSSVDLTRATFFASHRPKMVIRQLAFEVTGGIPSGLKFAVHNTGYAQGTISGIAMSVYLPNGDNDPRTRFDYPALIAHEIPIESGALANVLHELVQSGGQNLNFRYGLGPRAQIFIGGYIIYTDQIGVRRRTAIFREYDHNTKLFKASEDQEYEYQD